MFFFIILIVYSTFLNLGHFAKKTSEFKMTLLFETKNLKPRKIVHKQRIHPFRINLKAQ
jgi:hypothetical protein